MFFNPDTARIRNFLLTNGFNPIDIPMNNLYCLRISKDTECTIDLTKMIAKITMPDREFNLVHPYAQRLKITEFTWKKEELKDINLLCHNIDKFIDKVINDNI